MNGSKVKILIDVVENRDEYDWKEVNCLFKPFAIVHAYFNNDLFYCFLFYFSWYSIFYEGDLIKNVSHECEDFIDKYNGHIGDKFGIRINTVSLNNNTNYIDEIKRAIDGNLPVVVPIDSSGVFYSSSYLENSHDHYLIIKGYDEKKRVFHTLDNAHLDNGVSTIYKDFYVKFDDVFELNKMWIKSYSKKSKMPFFWKINNNGLKNYNSLEYDSILDYYNYIKVDPISKNKSRNIFLKNLYNNCSSNNEIILLNENTNLLNVHFEIFLGYIRKVFFESELINDLEKITKKILKAYKKVNFIVYYNQKKKESNSIDSVFRDIEMLEQLYIDLFLQISKCNNIEKIKFENTAKKSDNMTIVNINKAEILKNDNSVEMLHSDENVYDIWVGCNDAPQILWKPSNLNEFYIEFKLTIRTNKSMCHASGIIIKLSDNSKILFVIDQGDKIEVVVPEKGAKCKLFSIPYDEDSVYLRTRNKSDKILFDFKCSIDSQWEEIYDIAYDTEIEYYGIFSKTWENLNHSVLFEQLKF